MKTLTLLRHAKSGWDDPVARDFDRPLNAKGRRAAEVMGRHMRDAGFAFDHIVASHAIRVGETLDAIEA
ncbi:SixA phosphatase family protein, partial [Klebsiella pneumoniae]|uniref:SixA phosphatase family protein n=1 Tax=Klebsiella pneumoniae TaxID=573 RepID=UPI003FD56ABD